MDKFVITIARGFGSGGKQVAKRVAKELGLNCFENRIIALASQYSGYGEEYFQSEKLTGSYFANVMAKMPIAKYPLPVLSKFVSDPKLFDIQSQMIRKLAQEENCVIVGKAADHVLQDCDHVISVYIEAPRPYCVRRVMEEMPGTTESEAHELITKTDRYRADYYKYYTGGKIWDDVLNYDLVINTGRVGEDMATKLIVDYVKMRLNKN